MKLRLMLFIATVFLTSCNFIHTKKLNGNANIQPLTRGHFDLMPKCVNAWTALVEEWKLNGGGVKSSINLTRMQLQEDKASKLALIIRKAWAYQKEIGYAEKASETGRWPIVHEDWLVATYAPYSKSILPLDCEPTFWLSNILRKEAFFFRGKVKRSG